MNDICKFQMSKFLNGSRDYQVVVRANDIEEFQQALAQMKPIVDALEKDMPQKSNPVDNMQKQLLNQKCKKCGAEMVLNPKTGKVFCKDKCWLQQ